MALKFSVYFKYLENTGFLTFYQHFPKQINKAGKSCFSLTYWMKEAELPLHDLGKSNFLTAPTFVALLYIANCPHFTLRLCSN